MANRLKFIVSILLFALSALMLAGVWLTPPKAIEIQKNVTVRDKPVRVLEPPDLEQFASVWQKSLRRPFEEPKPAVKNAEANKKPPPAKPDIQLTQVMYSEDSQLAVFRLNKDGEMRNCKTGDTIQGATVKSIERDHVVVTVEETDFTFKVKK